LQSPIKYVTLTGDALLCAGMFIPLFPVTAMTRLTLFLSLSAFIAVLSFSAPTAPAQGYGLIQDDYDQYAQYFKKGRDPNFTTSESWRRKYADHRWAEYAEGDEYRDPMLAAEVLTGIYLIWHVDERLTYQIDNLIIGKAAMSNVLAERVTLDQIYEYITSNPDTLAKMSGRTTASAASGGSSSSSMMSGLSGMMGGSSGGTGSLGGAGGSSGSRTGTGSRAFYSEMELERMYALNRDIDEVARRKIVSGPVITRGQRVEIRSIQNLFDHSEKGWVPAYYFMRDKFLILDKLADKFTFNWSEEKREVYLAVLERVAKMGDEKIDKEEEVALEIQKMLQEKEREEVFVREIQKMQEDGKFALEIRREVKKIKKEAKTKALVKAVAPMMGSGMMGTSSSMGSSGMMSGRPMGTPMGRSPMGGPPMGGGGLDVAALMEMAGSGEVDVEKLKGMAESMGIAIPSGLLGESSSEELKEAAEAHLEKREKRELAYKYIVGVYESSEFHLATLRKIRRYFEHGANQGDPIAQYHLALFLRYLGEFVDSEMDESARLYESENWLTKAAEASDEMKKRVEILRADIAAEYGKTDKRLLDRIQKVLALAKVENDKLTMFDTVLVSVLANIQSSGSGSRSGGGYGGNRGGGGRSGGGYGGGGRGGY